MKKQLTINQLKKRRFKGKKYKDIHILVTPILEVNALDESTEIVGVLSPEELQEFDYTVDIDRQSEMGFYAVAPTKKIANDYDALSLKQFQKFMIKIELKKEVLK